MRNLFEQLIKDGESGVVQLKAERRQEGIDLEFKTKDNPVTGEPNKEDRKNLGVALSAFCNSMGGLIIWGVEARKNQDGVDCACDLKPIAEIERFKSEVIRLISQAIMPRHEGIRIEAIPASSPEGAGYLAIYVERSERRPHRCEFGEKQYFKRIGDSSIAMEHYDIEDSFKRLVVPWLEAELSVRDGPHRGDPEGHFRTVYFEISLRNSSPVTARFPYLILDSMSAAKLSEYGIDGTLEHGLPHRRSVSMVHFMGGADHVIHPGLSLLVAMLEREIKVDRIDGSRYSVPRGTLPPTVIAYRCGCYNSRQTEGRFEVPENELIKGIPGGSLR